MPILQELRTRGFSVWPFDDFKTPGIVEIYPRTFARDVVKSDHGKRRRHLQGPAFVKVAEHVLEEASRDENAFDALISAIGMAQRASEFASLTRATEENLQMEGQIWAPSFTPEKQRTTSQRSEKTRMNLGLENKIAIVAAASQGLGRAVALELAREGAHVTICARNENNLRDAVGYIERATGKTVDAHALDVTDHAAAQRFVAAVAAKHGRVDICVTNAGGPRAKKFVDVTLADWRSAIDLLLMSTVYFAREVLPLMQKNKWGRLITITSISVKQPVDGLLLSNSIRAAVAGLARTLANEFGPDGITVNNVCPGYTTTDRLNELGDTLGRAAGSSREAIFAQWSQQIPLRRLATPEEFAALVTFLASERASYITGTSIPVDGGWIKSLL